MIFKLLCWFKSYGNFAGWVMPIAWMELHREGSDTDGASPSYKKKLYWYFLGRTGAYLQTGIFSETVNIATGVKCPQFRPS